MASRCDIRTENSRLTIRIKPERAIWNFLFPPIMIAMIYVASAHMGWAGFVLWAMGAYLGWRWLWNAFGTEVIVVGSATFAITSRALGIAHTKQFPISDIDWIAYHRTAYRSPSAIGILAKQRVYPLDFAFDISEPDAIAILEALRQAPSVLASKVKLPSEHSYYNLS